MVILEKNLNWGRVGKAELKNTTCDKTGENTLCLSIDTCEKEYGEINLSIDYLLILIEFMDSIRDYGAEDWATTSIECDFCSHTWQAVHPAEISKLECPKCGNMTRF